MNMISFIYNLLWGDLFYIPLPGGSSIGISLMVLMLIPAGIYFTVRTKCLPIRCFPEMIRIARGKFPQENVRFLCGDVEELALEDRYAVIMVYNAFPHFPEPERLVRVLSGYLAPGGRLTIAHGMSRAAIDDHHRGTASKVSCGLISEHVLAAMMRKYLTLEIKISDHRMYQVTGRKG